MSVPPPATLAYDEKWGGATVGSLHDTVRETLSPMISRDDMDVVLSTPVPLCDASIRYRSDIGRNMYVMHSHPCGNGDVMLRICQLIVEERQKQFVVVKTIKRHGSISTNELCIAIDEVRGVVYLAYSAPTQEDDQAPDKNTDTVMCIETMLLKLPEKQDRPITIDAKNTTVRKGIIYGSNMFGCERLLIHPDTGDLLLAGKGRLSATYPRSQLFSVQFGDTTLDVKPAIELPQVAPEDLKQVQTDIAALCFDQASSQFAFVKQAADNWSLYVKCGPFHHENTLISRIGVLLRFEVQRNDDGILTLTIPYATLMKRRNHVQHALRFTRQNMANEMGEIADEQYEKMQQGIHLLHVVRYNNDNWLLFSYENLSDLIVAIRESAANDDNCVAAVRWWSTQKMRPPVDLRTPSRLSVTIRRDNDSIAIYRWQMKRNDSALHGQLVTRMECSLAEFFAV